VKQDLMKHRPTAVLTNQRPNFTIVSPLFQRSTLERALKQR